MINIINKISFGLLILLLTSCGKNSELQQANHFFNDGKYAKAIDVYSEYIKLNPSDIPAIYNRGRSYEESQQFEKALADYNKVLDIDENHVQANMSVAMDLYFRKEEYGQSVKYIDNALSKDNNNSSAYTLRGKVYQRLGDIDQSMKDYNNAININSENADAYYARASLYLSIEKNKKACQDFDMAKILGLNAAEEALEKYCK